MSRIISQAVVAVLAFAGLSQAANFQWSGAAADGLFGTDGNWVGGAAPGFTSSGDTIEFPAGPANKSVDAGGNAMRKTSYTLTGDYTLANGRYEASTSSNDFVFSGNNTISGNITTGGTDRNLILYQNAGGMLTLAGSTLSDASPFGGDNMNNVYFDGPGNFLVDTTSTLNVGGSAQIYHIGGGTVRVLGQTNARPIRVGFNNSGYARNGTLLVDSNTTSSVIVDSAAQPGNSVGGIGTINNLTVNYDSLIAPGTPSVNGGIGTLNVSGNAAFAQPSGLSSTSFATVRIQLGASGISDQIAIAGTLDGASPYTVLDFVETAPLSGEYTIMTFLTRINNQFIHTNVPAGYQVEYNPTSIKLVPIPEPTLALLLPAAALVMRRRGR